MGVLTENPQNLLIRRCKTTALNCVRLVLLADVKWIGCLTSSRSWKWMEIPYLFPAFQKNHKIPKHCKILPKITKNISLAFKQNIAKNHKNISLAFKQNIAKNYKNISLAFNKILSKITKIFLLLSKKIFRKSQKYFLCFQ